MGVNPASAAAPSDAIPTTDDPQLIDNQDPELLAEMRKQERLHPAAQKLLDAAMKTPTGSGYAGVAYEGDGITLYYKGALTPDMTAAVVGARRTAAVSVKAAAYSKAELEQAQRILSAKVNAERADVQAIGTLDDGSGLHVEKMPPATATALRATLSRTGRKSKTAEQLLAETKLGVPVTVTTGTAPITLMASRENDFPAWNGGGQYETWRGTDMRSPWCTTGFGVMKGSTSYVLTADHCMTTPDKAYNGHFGGCCFEEIGPQYMGDWDNDILLINARGSSLMFDGGVNSSVTKPVRSWGYRVTNELLCTSGSRSGVICGHKTSSGEYTTRGCDSDGDCFDRHDMARAVNVDGRSVGTEGDSGGPVFSLDGNGVRAKGIISGKDANNGTVLFYQDMDEIIGSFGVSIRTQ